MRKLLLLAALFSSPAFAKNAYLQCEMPSGPTATMTFNVTLDETNAQVDYEIVQSKIFVRKSAQFFADRVVFGVFSIDRTSLVMTRTSAFGFEKPTTDFGQCKLAAVKPRAF